MAYIRLCCPIQSPFTKAPAGQDHQFSAPQTGRPRPTNKRIDTAQIYRDRQAATANDSGKPKLKLSPFSAQGCWDIYRSREDAMREYLEAQQVGKNV